MNDYIVDIEIPIIVKVRASAEDRDDAVKQVVENLGLHTLASDNSLYTTTRDFDVDVVDVNPIHNSDKWSVLSAKRIH